MASTIFSINTARYLARTSKVTRGHFTLAQHQLKHQYNFGPNKYPQKNVLLNQSCKTIPNTFTIQRCSFFKKNNTPTPNSDQAQFASPFKRTDGSHRISSLDDIPDDSEAIMAKIIAKPKPTKAEIKQQIVDTQKRVAASSKEQRSLSNQLALLLISSCVLGWFASNDLKKMGYKAFPIENKIELFSQLSNKILETSFHQHLTSSSEDLIHKIFGQTITELRTEAAEQKKLLSDSGMLCDWASDSELEATYGPGALLATGSITSRIDPYSPVYTLHDEEMNDLDKFILLSVDNAQAFLRLYLSVLVMHLETQMTEPVFNYLNQPTQSTSASLTETKDFVWALLKDAVSRSDSQAHALLFNESQYEQLKRQPHTDLMAAVSSSTQTQNDQVDQTADEKKNASTNNITLFGLRRVLITFHYLLWNEFKDSMRSAPITLYDHAKKAVEEKHFTGTLPSEADFFIKFPHLYPAEHIQGLTLQYPLYTSDPESYYGKAIDDLSALMREEPRTLLSHLDRELHDTSRFRLKGFADDDDDGRKI